MSCINQFGQPVGAAVPHWTSSGPPKPVTLTGTTCRLEPLNITKHADDLFASFDSDVRLWTYINFGPFDSANAFRQFLETELKGSYNYFAIMDLKTEKPVGMIAFKGFDAANGVIEAGRAVFSGLLKQSTLSTETHYLLMSHVFDQLGYRRYEWTAHVLNRQARKSVIRLGFTSEAILRNAAVERGYNVTKERFSIIDDEWPILKEAFQAWLALENFDANGRQIRKLEDIRELIKRKIKFIPSSL